MGAAHVLRNALFTADAALGNTVPRPWTPYLIDGVSAGVPYDDNRRARIAFAFQSRS